MRCTACGDDHPEGTTTCPRTEAPVGGGPCGTVIDRYEVQRWIGGGGAGAVYRARHRMIGQPVALKLLRRGLERDVEAVARFKREAQAAAAIGHPRIPRMHDLGVTEDGRPFLVMDLLEGRDLRALFEAEAPLPPARAVDLTLQILEGLEAAHHAGIVHRDVKPANVFVVKTLEGNESVRLLDFGLSRMTEPMRTGALTAAGTVIGTPYYMSPEQALGSTEVDARADLYAAAVILYQALSRALPFPGDSAESVLVRIATAPPVPLAQVAPDVPASIVAVVDRGMARDPAGRWPTARAFSEALRGAILRAGPPTRASTLASALEPAAAFRVGPAPAAFPAAPAPAPAAAPTPALAAPAKVPPPASSNRALLIVAALFLLPLLFLAVAGGVAAVVGLVRRPAPPPPDVVATPAPAALPAPPALTGPENAPDAIRAALATAPVPAAPEPSAPKRSVTFGMPVLEGPLPDAALRELLGRARPTVDVCRPAAAPMRVRLRFGVAPSGSLTRLPFAGNEADVVVSSCVASRLEAQRLPPSSTTGSFRIEVALAPR